MEQNDRKRGSWWLVFGVAILNIFGLGAGYLMLGRWKRALAWGAFSLSFLFAVLFIHRLPLWAILTYVGGSLLLFVVLLIDSFIAARRGFVSRGCFYQRGYIYVLFVIASFGLGHISASIKEAHGGVSFKISSSSMHPTLQVGDHLIAPGYFGDKGVKRGDVVIFKTGNGQFYVWRVIGMPNEIFQMKAGVPYINGTPLAQTLRGEILFESSEKSAKVALYEEMTPEGKRHDIMMREKSGPLDDTPESKIPDGHVFVLGDNRQNSADSRVPDVGFVPLADVARKAELIYWSADRSRIGQRVH